MHLLGVDPDAIDDKTLFSWSDEAFPLWRRRCWWLPEFGFCRFQQPSSSQCQHSHLQTTICDWSSCGSSSLSGSRDCAKTMVLLGYQIWWNFAGIIPLPAAQQIARFDQDPEAFTGALLQIKADPKISEAMNPRSTDTDLDGSTNSTIKTIRPCFAF